jgi:large subunit ribosomal protein L18
MKNTSKKTVKRERRHGRIRAKVQGTAERPRLSVYKSNRYISGQIINDEKGVTLVAFTTKGLKGVKVQEASRAAGKELAKLALDKKVKAVVFDRGGFLYTGRVRDFAEGAREGGLTF